MSKIYYYPAIFNYSNDMVRVRFPDLPECFSTGTDYGTAFNKAVYSMTWWLKANIEKLPKPSAKEDIDNSIDKTFEEVVVIGIKI